ncbi:hypothetical protein EXIGLDRAFT_777944 [Exidia glandulosa HHB12029]|uniref:MYND-type domain-containing protein n=1 Tax=Exidia glandulosa HHB12029 TaxID=1314781 RepID=A0A165CSZ8_EXIGL|nr:hypothetical protein EXIGLDRAFT_777944 [Exidia glandulosa HHB12029]
MDVQARRLAQGLRDPNNPTFCPACAAHFFDTYLDPTLDLSDNVPTLRKNHHDLLTGIMRFLTTARSEVQLAAIQTSLRRATLECPLRRQVHRDFLPTGDFVDMVAKLMFSIILFCLVESSKLLATQRFSRQGLWPTTADDILPSGSRESLDALLFWFRRMRQPIISHAFELIFLVCRPELSTVLHENAYRSTFVDIFCSHIDWAVTRQRTPERRSPPRNVKETRDPMFFLTQIVQFLNAIYTGRGAVVDSFIRVVWGYEERVLASLDAALQVTDDQDLKRAIAVLESCLYQFLDRPVPVHIARLYDVQDSANNTNGFRRFYSIVSIISRSVVCCAPGCDTHQHQTVSGKLQRCAGCTLYQYCSRDCQKRHWSLDPLPHKAICRLLGGVFKMAPYRNLTGDQFAAACVAAGIIEEELCEQM